MTNEWFKSQNTNSFSCGIILSCLYANFGINMGKKGSLFKLFIYMLMLWNDPWKMLKHILTSDKKKIHLWVKSSLIQEKIYIFLIINKLLYLWRVFIKNERCKKKMRDVGGYLINHTTYQTLKKKNYIF